MSQTEAPAKVPIQPLHPEIIPRLDPEYIDYHNTYVQYLPLYNTIPWDAKYRLGTTVPGATEPLEVGKVQDFDLTHTNFRTYTPPGERPESGWPLLIYFHGGGWTFGRIDTESSFVTQMCINAKCVVMSVNYRLAPEHAYPIAVEDTIESLQWAAANAKDKLDVDMTRIAVGGSSSGGNLAAVAALKAPSTSLPHPLVFQMLIVPVTDNTSTPTSPSPHASWKTNEHSPWLSPARMLWFRNNYLPDESKRAEWLASPLFAPEELLKATPRCWTAVTELDILKDEGERYAERLQAAGVESKVVVYEKAPHPIMAMDGMLSVGKKMVKDAGDALREAFWPGGA